MKIRQFNISILLLLFTVCFSVSSHGQTNVLYMMADDLGWNDLSIHGSDIPTPHIDSIFNQGVEMSNFMAWAVCSPTRAGFLTGIHPLNTNMGPETNGHLGAESVTIAEVFKQEGYRTGVFGKWHNGEACWKDEQGNPILDKSLLPGPAKDNFDRTPYEYNVNDHGFDEWAGFYGGGTNYGRDEANNRNKEVYGIPNWFHNNLYVPTVWDTDPNYIDDRDGYVTDLIGDYAVDFISQSHNAGDPFFCYIPFSAPHATPHADAKYEYRDANNPDSRIPNGRTDDAAKYAEMVILMDDQVGRIINHLDALGIKDDTIIIFTSDNGATIFGDNSPFQGGKHSSFEGGYHVPTAFQWGRGGLVGGSTYSGLISFIDMFPTLMSMCDLNLSLIPQGIDGKSIWDDQNNRMHTTSPVETFFIAFKGTHAIRTETYKYRNDKGSQVLYNLSSDPGEANDIKNNNSAKYNELRNLANQFMDVNEIKLSHVAHSIGASEYASASGDVLRVVIEKTAALADDYQFRLSDQTPEAYMPGGHDATHYLDYDLFIPSTSSNVEFNIALASSAGNRSWFETHGAFDQEGNEYKNFPANGYSKAVNKWYKYRIGTGNYAPRNAGRLMVKLHKDTPNGTYEFFLDNVVLGRKDREPFVMWESDSDTRTDLPSEAAVNVTVSTVSAEYMVTNYGYNDSTFVSIDYPSEIFPGMDFIANVTFTNSGNSNWTSASEHKIGSESPRDNFTWGTNRWAIPAGVTVAPGEHYTFPVLCTAPSTPGNYDMQWATVQEGVQWFGDQTSLESVTVMSHPDNYAQFVSENLPASVAPGESFNAELTFKNIGTNSWTAAGGYRLVSQNSQWGAVNSVDVNTSVASGESHTFIIPCTAPIAEGDVAFQWRLEQQGGIGLFGDLADTVINVVPVKPAGLIDRTDEAGAVISSEFSDSPAAEGHDNIFDNDTATKYLTFHSGSWVQHQFANSNKYTVVWYSVTSANDAEERDPLNWTLSGSNDGQNWTIVDSRSGVDFPNRFQTLEFSAITNTTAYEYYRFEAVNNSSSILQYAEIELWGDANEGSDSYEFWKSSAFQNPSDPNTGRTDDYDGDGRSNQYEFIFGMDPEDADNDQLRDSYTDNDNGSLTITFNKRNDGAVSSYEIETSTDLQNWSTNQMQFFTEINSQTSGDVDTVTYRYNTVMSAVAGQKLFFRVRAEE